MRWTSILAIYVLFWTISLFLVLPFGVRTSEEAGAEVQPGQADSAPHVFSFPRAALRATIVAAVLFGLYLRQLRLRLDHAVRTWTLRRPCRLIVPRSRIRSRSRSIAWASAT